MDLHITDALAVLIIGWIIIFQQGAEAGIPAVNIQYLAGGIGILRLIKKSQDTAEKNDQQSPGPKSFSSPSLTLT